MLCNAVSIVAALQAFAVSIAVQGNGFGDSSLVRLSAGRGAMAGSRAQVVVLDLMLHCLRAAGAGTGTRTRS